MKRMDITHRINIDTKHVTNITIIIASFDSIIFLIKDLDVLSKSYMALRILNSNGLISF